MANQANVASSATETAAPGRAMDADTLAIAREDMTAFKSSHATRTALVNALVAMGVTVDWFKAPAEGECREFYEQMMSLSREALECRASDKGLTEAEKALIAEKAEDGEGVYQVATLLDREIKASNLPTFLTESKRIGNLSIQRYWRQQEGVYLRSVRDSVGRYYAALELVAGGAQARTKSHAERQAADLRKVISRHQKADEDTEVALAPNEVAYLCKIVKRWEDEGLIEKPKDESESE